MFGRSQRLRGQGSRGERPQPDAIEVMVGPRATFAGTMRSETSIRIDGAVEGGLVETPANVILTEPARVTCEIVAKTVSIRGQFHGTIRADRVELLAGCHVSGVIYVNSFYMDDGVIMQAEVNLRNGTRPGLPVAPRPLPVLGPGPEARPPAPPASPAGTPAAPPPAQAGGGAPPAPVRGPGAPQAAAKGAPPLTPYPPRSQG